MSKRKEEHHTFPNTGSKDTVASTSRRDRGGRQPGVQEPGWFHRAHDLVPEWSQAVRSGTDQGWGGR